MQFVGRLLAEEMQREFSAGIARPFIGSIPCGMAGAIRIAEPGNHFGKQLDPAAGRPQRVGFRVVTECLHHRRPCFRWLHLEIAPVNETVIIRQFNTDRGGPAL